MFALKNTQWDNSHMLFATLFSDLSPNCFRICPQGCDLLGNFILLFQVLEKYPNTPMSHKEILQVIQRERLKEIR